MRPSPLPILLLMAAALALGATARSRANSDLPDRAEPVVLGHGVGLFEVGALLFRDDFEDLDNWVVQVQQREGGRAPSIRAVDSSLDCLVPGRGCTVWFKQRLKGRVTISYDVVCPTPEPEIGGVQPRDINNFWMASDPDDPEGGLFDPDNYTGAFSSYDKMHGYYASTGGGKNSTTRMRRYPREVDGAPAEHLALTARDGDQDYLITPDRVMRVQLVAYDDVIQYIVDGKLNYEIARGDQIQIEGRNTGGKRVMRDGTYNPERLPVYHEGYFGFRMVGTHHVYSNFRVHRLEPAQREVAVSSIGELREAMGRSNQRVVMEPGIYTVDELVDGGAGFHLSGSHNHFDLSGVTIRMPISTLRKQERRGRRGRRGATTFLISGDHITVAGCNFENTYPEPKGEITDFGRYNQISDNYPAHGANEMRVQGDDIQIVDCRFTVRGSSPYGYGNIYGIGGGAVVPLRKHCGIQITGDRITIDRCHLKMEAFGHAIYVLGGDQITVRDTEVEGEVRPSNDLYLETNDGDLAKKFDYKIRWPESVRGLPIPRDHMINLMEDGIRAYQGTGHMTVENCKVIRARGGIKLYMAKSATVSDCEVRDCVIQGYSLPSRGSIVRSRGNAAYGPLLYVHGDSHSSQEIELEILPSPHALGDHPLAAIRGKNHRIKFTSKGSVAGESLRPIIIGYPLRFDFLSADYPEVPDGYEQHFEKFAPERYRASDITLDNDTNYPVVLGKLSQGNHISTRGAVRDLGTDNSISSQQ